jgi:putative membrane protein
MAMVTQVLIGLIALLHVYFLLLETVLFKTRGRRVFGLSAEKAEILAPVMSNMGCYNGFLAAALAIGLFHHDHHVRLYFVVYGLTCVAVAGVWGAVTVKRAILFIQTVPAVIALIMFHIPA